MISLKKHLIKFVTLLIIVLNSADVKSQNFVIDSIALPDSIMSCNTTYGTVYTFLGCVNWSLNTITVNKTSDTAFIDITRNDPLICFGALTWPTHSVNLGLLPPGNYTIITRALGTTSGVYSTLATSVFVYDCCPNATFSAEFSVSDSAICAGDSIICTPKSVYPGLNYAWYLDNVLKDSTTSYTAVINGGGSHRLRLDVDSGGTCFRSAYKDVSVKGTPDLDLGFDLSFCAGQNSTISTGPRFKNVTWNTGDTTRSISVSDSGIYWVTAMDTGNCGYQTDSLEVFLKQSALTDLGNDTVLCQGAELLLDASFPSTTFLWQDNSKASTFKVTQAGKYWVRTTFTPTLCLYTDTINVGYKICTGIDEKNELTGLSVSPNPFINEITISNPTSEKLTMKLYGYKGELVLEESFSDISRKFDVSALPNGLYIMKVTAGNESSTFKLVK